MMLKSRLPKVGRRGIGRAVHSLAFATRNNSGLKPELPPNIGRPEGEAGREITHSNRNRSPTWIPRRTASPALISRMYFTVAAALG